MSRTKRQLAIVLAIAAVMLTVLGASVASSASTAGATGKLEVFSWWTSGGESVAKQALFDATKKANPGISIVDAAVAGGAGGNARQVLATRLAAGDIPETWQSQPGGSLSDYYDQGVLTPVTDLYKKNGWDKVVPAAILKSVTFKGNRVAVLTGMHRSTVVWTNSKLFKRAGVKLGKGSTFAQLKAAAKKLKAKGITPLCVGDKDIWTADELLEALIVGQVGASGHSALLDGTMKWSSPAVARAVSQFNEAMTWANKDHKSQDWASAVGLLAQGKCAMNVMGDWAYGELQVKWKKVWGKDFSSTIIGNPATFVGNGDAFVVGKGSKNPAAARAWLEAIMEPSTQIAFNKLKGSSPVRSDVNLSALGPYQQMTATTLKTGVFVPSLTHGEALINATVGQAFADSVTLLEANHSAKSFGKAMDSAIAAS